MDLDTFLASATPRTRTVHVCGRGDLAAEHDSLLERLQQLAMDPGRSLGGDPEVGEVQHRIDALLDEMEEHTLSVKLRCIGAEDWQDLVAAHPPSKDDLKRGHDTNPATFPAAAVAVSAVAPKLTPEQAKQLRKTLSPTEWGKLYTAVLVLHLGDTSVPKMRAATASLRPNGRSSTTAESTGSPGPGSLAGSGEA